MPSSRGRPAPGSFRAIPIFAPKAGRALDLYARVFDGERLRPDEYVISADEKTQRQALGQADERRLPQRQADPPPRARLLAEPDRDLLLDLATQSPDPERLRHSPRAGATPDGLQPALPHHRTTVRVHLHPSQARSR